MSKTQALLPQSGRSALDSAQSPYSVHNGEAPSPFNALYRYFLVTADIKNGPIFSLFEQPNKTGRCNLKKLQI